MKRTLLLCITILGLYLCSTANPIDQETAQSIASKFMGSDNVQLAATYRTDKNTVAFYVFNSTDGFVIVSADDCETPIIGYSHESRFDPNNIPVQMEDYLQDFVARIQYGIENHIQTNEATARQWALVTTTGRLNEHRNAQAVEPLLTEIWEQGCLYNSLCPSMEHTPCGHAEVGCVAVAMGQIMHYWKYPETGWDSHSYYNYGVQLSADFGNTVYDWDHMPDSLTETSSEEEIEAVATLLFHCGVSVNMGYDANGSNASSTDVPNALIRYFNYSRHLHRDPKGNDNAAWLTKIKDCLDLGRPIFYSGSGSAGGHAFVCDGYDDNDLLHFNWGWGRANGYFALGNLNPLDYTFNNNNSAIFDIVPQYEPCLVAASAYLPEAGHIEGCGEYHYGEQCTLTAIPNENCQFRYWKKDDRIISYESTYSFEVKDNVDNLIAYFSFLPLKEITANHTPDTNDVNSPYVSLQWNYDNNTEWPLLKEFEINKEDLITTDNEYIYTSYKYGAGYPYTFCKYTMDGDSVESFHIEGARPDGLTCDGNYFYCSKNTASYDVSRLYHYDFTNKTLVDSTYMYQQFGLCAYDSYYDGFWLLQYTGLSRTARLVNRQGQTIDSQQVATYYDNIYGFGGFIAEDGNPHLLTVRQNPNYITDINLQDGTRNTIRISSSNPDGYVNGACLGKYDNKDALFVITRSYASFYDNNKVQILEIRSHLAPILHYRLYRTNLEGDTLMLADEYTGTSFIDSTWADASAGTYRFGISEVYFNGVESEIIWSDTIVKSGIGIEENLYDQDVLEQPVQKVIENGQIVIIKDGKRYNVKGQPLN